MTEQIWMPFIDWNEGSLALAKELKTKKGLRVVGHMLPDAPEELIHAAGAIPLSIEGARAKVSLAQAHMPSYTCAHALGTLEMGLRGELGFLDALIIPYVCDTTRNLSHVWRRALPSIKSTLFRLPKRIDHPGAASYLKAELRRLGRFLGSVTGREPDEASLRDSISLYNQSRSALRDAYELHREGRAQWTAHRLFSILGSAMKAPREDHLQWMRRLPWDAGQGRAFQIPLYVRGKVWDPPELPSMLDELGFVIMKDEVVTGWRSIEVDAPMNGDPFEALVHRHLHTTPYPGYYLEPKRVTEGFLHRVKESGAQGVLFLNPKFCEEAGFETPELVKALQEEGIPSLVLETSAGGLSVGQLRVRLEAFAEVLGGEL